MWLRFDFAGCAFWGVASLKDVRKHDGCRYAFSKGYDKCPQQGSTLPAATTLISLTA